MEIPVEMLSPKKYETQISVDVTEPGGKAINLMPQKQKTASRKRLTAAKLRLKLGGWPDIREPLPPKAKWKHRKRYQKLRNQIQELEAQANRTRFRKQIDIRTFAAHVG
jgi:hypothetical protein